MNRRFLLFSGRVQGVGFRYTTRQLARRYEVTGFVRNLPDGRVEAIIEGELAEIGRFEETLREAMRPNIENVTVEDAVATGEFRAFDIR